MQLAQRTIFKSNKNVEKINITSKCEKLIIMEVKKKLRKPKREKLIIIEENEVETTVNQCIQTEKENISSDLSTNKQCIIDIFMSNVKGKKIELGNYLHCGSEGHWLEKQMGINHNSKNEPDIFGYEMKKHSSKISFGDFSASEYLFSKNKNILEIINGWNKNEFSITRNEFIRWFGTPNPLKNNRYSWSGNCVPKYDVWNNCGQSLNFNDSLDLCVNYSYEKDERECKINYPLFMKEKNITLTIWNCEKLKQNVNKKFNNKGFFICKKNENTYDKICFGNPFDFNYFIENIKNKSIIFDSGMYEGNSRNYSQFRSSSRFWDNLIIEEF